MWIYDNEIDRILGDFENGDLVTVHDFDGYFMYNRVRKRCSLQNHLSNKKQGESDVKHKIKREFQEFVILLKSVPSVLLSLFILSIVLMNSLANKSIDIPLDWLALDCGIIVSWLTFYDNGYIDKTLRSQKPPRRVLL